MRIYDIIEKKKRGGELSNEEICYAVKGYVSDKIPDYQIAALLMAIYFQGMSDQELYNLTDCMAKSGETADLSQIDGIKVDKHSTGGVGDKTTLAVAPLVAACGGKVAKMSGRGLGFTGGTIDKLESIPGMQTALNQKQFFEMVNRLGLAVIGQSADIAPADKKLYALRDVTATVDSIPLIAASIMSKKLAAGSDKIVLDVTVGSGAFMKNLEDAITLAEKMVVIGEKAGREMVAILTNMDVPLGIAVGNDIEMIEAVEMLQGNGPEDFREICHTFAREMLVLSGQGTEEECDKMLREAIKSGAGLKKLADMVAEQGGDSTYIYHTEKFPKAKYSLDFVAEQDGYVVKMDTEQCGKTAVMLGAGRETKDSLIDSAAGIRFFKKTGQKVRKGDILATLYASKENILAPALSFLKDAYQFGQKQPEPQKNILAKVTKDRVILY
ncbi:MAG: thymidine phosphorylase [Clostridiaceae bacterium]|nr:thymidine phosphorylase [Clostridiaceae bacterium]